MSEIAQSNVEEAMSVRVLLVDDHDLFRTGLRNLLEEQDVEVVGRGGRGRRGGCASCVSSRPTSSSWT